MNGSNTSELMTTLVFLMDGFNAEHDYKFGKHPEHGETYELHANMWGGYVGIVSGFSPYVFVIQSILRELDPQDFPGVFHYEVTEELGAWIFHHPEKDIGEFRNYARGVIDRWFEDGLAGQDRPCGISCLPGFRNCPGCPVDIDMPNAPRLVGVTKEKSTMKIEDLLSQLQNIRDQYGNVDVVIRGNKPNGFVDAQEVRSVKTTKRRAVYIGKASQGSTAQE